MNAGWVGGTALLPLCLFLAVKGSAGASGHSFLVAYTAMCLIYGFLYWKCRRTLEQSRSSSTMFGILLIGVLARILIFPMPVSDDVYRYLWEGRFQQLGGNPYTVAPADAEHWVPSPSRPDRYRGRVNHPELTTVYAPGAEVLFLLVAEFRYSARVWKLLMIVFELVLVGVLIRLLQARGQPRARIWRYFWHPLVLVAFAGEGHLEVVLMLGTWVFFLGLARHRPALAALGWSIAILTKFLGGLYLPIAIRRLNWKGMVLTVVLGIAFTLPFLDAGFGLIRTLVLFGREMSYNASWQSLVAPLAGELVVRIIGLTALVTAALLVLVRNWDPVRSGFYLTATFLFVAPTVHPWYLTGLVPFLLFRWRTWTVIWSCTVGWAYISYSVLAETGEFRLPHVWALAEYIPVYAAFFWWISRRRRSRPDDSGIKAT